MDERPGFDPNRDLSERDREMLSRHTEELTRREAESRNRNDNRKSDGSPKEWVVEQPVVHHRPNIGRPEDVKRGDRADVVGHGSRHLSHPADNEKLPLKGR